MQKYFYLLTLICTVFGVSAQQVIPTEISYNPPESGNDSLEYIELYNMTDQAVDLTGWSFTNGVTYDSITGIVIPGESYIVIAKDQAAVEQTLGVAVAGQWSDGSFSNGGEQITLVDADGVEVFDVTYDDRGDWPSSADGTDGSGATIELCDLTADPAMGVNWQASSTGTGVFIDGIEFFGTPGAANACDPTQGPMADLVVTEILYNDPSSEDDLEFFEIYNRGDVAVDLAGYTFTSGIDYTFGEVSLEPDDFLIMAKDGDLINSTFGITAITWQSGALSNGGETIELRDTDGMIVLSFTYDDEGDWDTAADGEGPSLAVCNPRQDNNDPSYWAASPQTASFATMYDGSMVYTSIGRLAPCELSIGEVTVNDSVGLSTYNDVSVILNGTVHSPNFRDSGYEFAIQDEQGEGIIVFLFDQDLGYEVALGDQLRIEGRITHFNGLTEIIPEAIEVLGTDDLQDPRVTTELSNATEGELVLLEDVMLVDPSQWTETGARFDVDVTNGTEVYTMRIDADIDLFSTGVPTGTFDVAGIGWQFDPQSPYDEGFFIQPRSSADLSPYSPTVPGYPAYDIATVTTVDAEGELDSNGVRATLTGVVHGPNFRFSGLDFPLIDDTNNGIRVINLDSDLGVTIAEGDEVEVKGTVSSFRGLAQILVDSIEVLSSGNDLVEPVDITAPSEAVEGSLVITTDPLTWVDESQWLGDGSSFSIDATNGVDTFEIFIDNNNELSDLPIPASGEPFRVLGIGNQFDRDAPFVDNYQVMLRYPSDVLLVSSVDDDSYEPEVVIYPNPVRDQVQVTADHTIVKLTVRGTDGRLLRTAAASTMSLQGLQAGLYLLEVETTEGAVTQTVIKL